MSVHLLLLTALDIYLMLVHRMMGGALKQQHMNGVLWCGFVLTAVFVYWLFSDGDFSFLMVRVGGSTVPYADDAASRNHLRTRCA